VESIYNEIFQWLMLVLLLAFAVVTNYDMRRATNEMKMANAILQSMALNEKFDLTNDPRV
jgi:hypothetical protein